MLYLNGPGRQQDKELERAPLFFQKCVDLGIPRESCVGKVEGEGRWREGSGGVLGQGHSRG